MNSTYLLNYYDQEIAQVFIVKNAVWNQGKIQVLFWIKARLQVQF